MSGVLLLEDQKSLLAFVDEWVKARGLSHVALCNNLVEARKIWRQLRPSRIIADHKLEGEDEDGLSFLEEVRRESRATELILCTGNPVRPPVQQRIDEIGAKLVRKSQVDIASLEDLLTPGSSVDLPSANVDIALLRLEADTLRKELADLRELNDLLIADLVTALAEVDAPQEPRLMIEDRILSAAELRQEVMNRSVLGRKLIKIYSNLNRRLRG